MTDTGRSTVTGATGTAPEGWGRKLPRPSFTWGLVFKLLFLALVNALALVAIGPLVEAKQWGGLVAMLVATAGIDYVYLSKRTLPLKYLVPGTIFALMFQVYPVLYSANISFTNYGTGHVLTKEQALQRLASEPSVQATGERFQMITMAADGGTGDLGLYLLDVDGIAYLGTAEGLTTLDPAEVSVDADGRVTAVGDFSALNFGQAQDRQAELVAFEVPTDRGTITVQSLTAAVIQPARYLYDDASGLLTDVDTGIVYTEEEGNFVSPDGASINPGWRVYVGMDNFTKVVTSPAIRGPFVRVFIWNFIFAVGSVVLTFVVGLALAITLNHPQLRGRKLYRSLLIIPYALPSFMTVLVWQGMLNTEYGIVNDLLNADIQWLQTPIIAKVSILLVNTWLGYAYFFLVSTGALQAIPAELVEAASVDGATPWNAFRNVTFPLLMVAVAPLLISSFAFNFNNFNVIYLLTGGGPPIPGAQTPAGHTDILISYTYRLAFERGSGTDFGLASAISIIIFIIVASISAASFVRTRALEELT
jgi:arabinogalactan oligomer/maltooligosaccharide transport system permease protein